VSAITTWAIRRGRRSGLAPNTGLVAVSLEPGRGSVGYGRRQIVFGSLQSRVDTTIGLWFEPAPCSGGCWMIGWMVFMKSRRYVAGTQGFFFVAECLQLAHLVTSLPRSKPVAFGVEADINLARGHATE
jgi:hypothetical protein